MANDKIEKRTVEPGKIDMGRKQEVVIQFRYNTKTEALRGVKGKAFYVAIDDSFFIPRKNFPAPPTLEDEFDLDVMDSYHLSGLTGEDDKNFVMPQPQDDFDPEDFSGELDSDEPFVERPDASLAEIQRAAREENNLPPRRRWRRRP